MPELLKDAKADPFFRHNFGLAVARQLANNRVYEEALVILKGFNPEQTIDPATYLFHRAVAEHGLLKKDEARETLARLLQDAADSPERYRTVSTLLLLDLETWRKDLGNVARLMENSERRLEIARGGPETQDIQKKIIARLDELIKELEGHGPRGGPGGGGKDDDHPDDGPAGKKGGAGGKPLDESRIILTPGTGNADIGALKKMMNRWGELPKAQQAKVTAEIEDMIRSLSPVHRAAFERYWEEISQQAVPPRGRQ